MGEIAELITQIVSNLGFPIAVCVACFWYINKQNERHREEMNNVTEAINNNTIALTKLLDKIGQEEQT